jgi:hypothetical protein
VTVAATVFEPGVTEFGEMLQDAFVGTPPQVRVTALPKVPPTEATFTVYVAVFPAWTVALLLGLTRLKSDAVPDSGMV